MNKKQKKTLIRIIIALVITFAIRLLRIWVDVPELLYVVPYLVVGYDILIKAIKGIRNLQPFDENFLMVVATIGAVVLGDYLEGAAVMLFYQIGELFQSVAVGKSRRSISALMDIRPDYANLVIESGTEKVDPDEIEIGSLIRVLPGEKIPIDGVIVAGETSLNTVALTGESIPRKASIGDEVISGSINESSVIDIRTTKEFGDSTVSKILELVENSSSRKSKSEKFISKFAKYYTPIVCMLAIILAVVPPIILGGGFKTWIYRAFTFLVISCPCALVISIPLTFFAGIGGAGRDGILIKGANYVETLSKASVAVFDKTGTLTKGVFDVDAICENGVDPKKLLEMAAHVESLSNHPIAKSILRCYGGVIDPSRVYSLTEFKGGGVTAIVDGQRISCGNEKLMAKEGIKVNSCELGNKESSTVVHVSIDGVYAGHIHIQDIIKPDSKDAIAMLYGKGFDKLVMLTGDRESVAREVSLELGIKDYKSELMPGDKVSEVEKLLNSKKPGTNLVFVGDGINDAPVLTRADVGIAMGALGQDAAIEAADVVLMDDNPIKIAHAVGICRKCMRIVYENIYFAIGIKVLCLILGALGIANMWLAIFADVGVMVLAVLNAIRALNYK